MNKRLIFLLFGLVMTHTVSAGMNSHTYYRTFWHPLLDDVRLAWCLDGGKTCGKTTANRYCQIMGYMRTVGYRKQLHVAATEELGSNKLCYGENCVGFSSISCYR